MRDERSVGSWVAVAGAVLGVVLSVAGYLGFAGLTDVLAPPKKAPVSTTRAGTLGSFGVQQQKDDDLERPVQDRKGDAYFLLFAAAVLLGAAMAVTVLPREVRGVFMFPFIGLALPGSVVGVGTLMVGLLFR